METFGVPNRTTHKAGSDGRDRIWEDWWRENNKSGGRYRIDRYLGMEGKYENTEKSQGEVRMEGEKTERRKSSIIVNRCSSSSSSSRGVASEKPKQQMGDFAARCWGEGKVFGTVR